jgi:hypothetical protein
MFLVMFSCCVTPSSATENKIHLQSTYQGSCELQVENMWPMWYPKLWILVPVQGMELVQVSPQVLLGGFLTVLVHVLGPLLEFRNVLAYWIWRCFRDHVCPLESQLINHLLTEQAFIVIYSPAFCGVKYFFLLRFWWSKKFTSPLWFPY